MRSTAILVALLSIAAGSLGGQTAERPLLAGPVYTSSETGANTGNAGPRYPEFDVVVSLDPRWNASALNASDWEMTETGATAPRQAVGVRRFEQTEYGVAVTLALDVSGSMQGKTLDRIRKSITKFVDDAQPQDRVAVMTFADDARWDVPFTAHLDEVREAIKNLSTRGRHTRLYDSMITAIDRFDDAMPRRRVLIVMSDGHDEGSQHTLDDVIADASSRKISINAIGVTRSDPKYLASLQTIAQSTGGNYAAARSDDELDQLISNGIVALKQTPVVTFRTLLNFPRSEIVPVKILWKPQAVHATAELTTVVLPEDNHRRKLLYASLAIFGLLLAIFLIILLVLRSRRQKHAVAPAPYNWQGQNNPYPVQQAQAYGPGDNVQPPFEPYPFAVAPGNPSLPEQMVQGSGAASPVRPTRLASLFEVSAAGLPLFYLEASSGPIAGSRVAVRTSLFTIGAAAGNSLRIDEDPSLSGNHARLSLEHSILLLDDLGSTNGTYVNGVKMAGTRCPLAPGDEFRVGRSVFRIHAARNS